MLTRLADVLKRSLKGATVPGTLHKIRSLVRDQKIDSTDITKYSVIRCVTKILNSNTDPHHIVDGINLATLAGLLEDVQGYEAAIPVRTDCSE